MYRELVTIIAAVFLAVLAGPVSVALGSVSKTDDGNLYLVVGSNAALRSVLAQSEVREIGPYRAPFARLVHASTDFHSSLVAWGYWVFPATSIAELCGVQLSN